MLAPTVAIIQWKNEIEKFTEGFKVLVFHGQNRITKAKELEKYDVVLTSCTFNRFFISASSAADTKD